MKLVSLFSGSSGNSIYVESDGCRLLFDAGSTCRKIQTALTEIDVKLKDIDAIFVTHEHADHVSALGVVGRNAKIPVYCNEPTAKKLLTQRDHPAEMLMNIFSTGSPINIKGLEITSFHISHDAAEPVGYKVCDGKSALGIATDTGVVTEEIFSALSGCKALLFESNHDIDMLKTGPYPAYLKQRILSDYGHLSNASCGKALASFIENGSEKMLLGHLSKENNTPFSAFNTVSRILDEKGYKRNSDYVMNVARRDGISDPVII